MDTDSLDIKNSISQQRTVFNRDLDDKVWYYIYYASFILSLLIVVIMSSVKLITEDISIFNVVAIIIAIIFGFLIFYALKNNNHLVSIKGIDISQNKKLVMKSAKELGWYIESNRKSHSILSKPMSWRNNHWGRDMVIFYENKCIYFNCITPTRAFIGNSPFNWFGNRSEEEKFTHVLLDNIYKTYKQ
ncbi:hypothetical protein GCM10007424_20110 [Flavobacterium suaedae]|uniref:YcxB family protein n=1 Tax=Flavobacterium suaedae TaxID=1767027 RepID=A0ABQ1JZZ1_9FLAO|nr:hypothetical protein [Flavobacterium suaedae]GGB79951.1 hypothetical protein GCM10007424_20110 [Flavobacterium suaedae]